MKVLFLFIDGLGLGDDVPTNPFFANRFSGFEQLIGGKPLTKSASEHKTERSIFKGIDACLGIEGLPQSGTGQATLFSGINASAIIGKHFGPFPHTGIKPLLLENSLFHRVQSLGKSPFFINAFPQVFFDRANVRNRWSSCTLMTKSAGIPLNSVQEVLDEKALTAEIIQDYWKKFLDIPVPAITTEIAAKRAYESLIEHDLVLMEYYLTDKAGHAQNMEDAQRAIERVDAFISAFVDEMNRGKQDVLLLITSDHGNIEDLDVKTHTFNEVPLIVYSSAGGASRFEEVIDLTGITPAIIDVLKS
jgi:2,3-bisphosphoglycerate-independent phosphoglycerate mutase